MPEPGIRDRNFDRPTTTTPNDTLRRAGAGIGRRLKIPAEYAEFRLSDGGYLGDVMGEDFFDAEMGTDGAPIGERERQAIRDVDYPLARTFRNDPRFEPGEKGSNQSHISIRREGRFADKWAEQGWGGPRGFYGVPVLNKARERIDNILADKPGRFDIRENPAANSSDPWYASGWAGDAAIASYGRTIEQEAKRQGVDPDLVKAIVYSENARGHYFGSAKAAEGLDKADSFLPMNINPDIWGGLGIDRKSAGDYLTNIRAGITLIKRISDRIDDPTPSAIASIWNYAGREVVNDFGAYTGRIYREKPWKD